MILLKHLNNPAPSSCSIFVPTPSSVLSVRLSLSLPYIGLRRGDILEPRASRNWTNLLVLTSQQASFRPLGHPTDPSCQAQHSTSPAFVEPGA